MKKRIAKYLLICVGLILCFIFGYIYFAGYQQRTIVSKLSKNNCVVNYSIPAEDSMEYGWFDSTFGKWFPDSFYDITCISVGNHPGAEVIESIVQAYNLEELLITGDPFDNSWEALSRLNNLKKVSILSNDEPMSGDNLAFLSGISNLSTLEMAMCKFTGTNFPSLEATSLKVFIIRRCSFTDDHMISANLPASLKVLSLRETDITDSALTNIACFCELQAIELEGSAITSSGVEALTSLNNLVFIDLDADGIDETIFPVLKKFSNLQKVVLPSALLESTSREYLESEFPNIEFVSR